MDKNAIKKYAVWARTELIDRVTQKALQYGITEKDSVPASATSVNGVVLSKDEMQQRKALLERIAKKGYKHVIEEVAYTWFNRFSALRFMEVNGYLPSRVRVFTDEHNQFNPQILTEAISLEMAGLDMEKVYAYKDANDDEGLFKYLIIVQCNALNPLMPRMFQRISDYTELLFPDNLLREGSAVQRMIEWIPEEDWKDAVQIIGWLYQFYNIEPKAEVFAKSGKISKEEIPAATQLFTPDWIVRYMVENSLGRLWIEGHPNDELRTGWQYYLDEAEQEPAVQTQLAAIRKEYASITPAQIKCIDPCAGSGHILAYMFDVLMQIYETYGYTTHEAVRSIVENNIYGLDIDERAAQLAYFSVMMKARQYDRRFLIRKDENGNPDVPQPHIHDVCESNGIDSYTLDYFINGDSKLKTAMNSIVKDMNDAKEYGSLINVSPVDFDALFARLDEVECDINISRDTVMTSVKPLITVAAILAQKYDAVITNPPYMSVSVASPKLQAFIKKHYVDGRSDLFAVFIEKCKSMLKRNGFQAMITMHSWMFLSSFENLREKILAIDTVNMAHLGARAFEEIGGEVVQTCSFVFRKSHIRDYRSVYCRLVEPTTQDGKKEMYLSGEGRFIAKQNDFAKIPGAPIIYNFSDETLSLYDSSPKISQVGITRLGMTTANNELFVRLWHEVNIQNCLMDASSAEQVMELGRKWVPYNKGGFFRKWYGNLDCLVNWDRDGYEIKHYGEAEGHIRSTVPNTEYYFRECGTWSKVSSGNFAMRYRPNGSIFDVAGACLFAPTHNDLLLLMGFMNSAVAKYLLSSLSPTMNFEGGQISNLPVAVDRITDKDQVTNLVSHNIKQSKCDWDAFEISWDFIKHPLVPTPRDWAERRNSQFASIRVAKFALLSWHYDQWTNECQYRFDTMKENEEELNRIFIDIYGLQDELTPEVATDKVTVRLADKKRDIKSLISYAVGCMFGRYSLDVDGLAYAGGDWDEVYRKDRLVDEHGNAITFGGINLAVSKDFTQINVDGEWKDCTFPVDVDNIIPICVDDYFDDDIVGRFTRFIEVVYGKDTLQENLRFIADALGGSGQPKDVIRNYFLNDFYTDHLKIYQKRPIYWLFDSGKKGGFKALVYMHRYQPDTIARMRTDYVHEQQARYRTAIADLEQRIASASTSERVKLNKRLKKLQEQALEIQSYEEKIHHLADQYIAIDLDDGVKVNYAKFQDVLAKIK